MVTISFSMFKDKLISGEKQTTIRQLNIPRLEQMKRLGIQIYWMQRTPQREKLFEARLVKPRFIRFSLSGYPFAEAIVDDYYAPVPLDGYPERKISHEEQEEIARRDGFCDANDMANMFVETYGLKLVDDGVFHLPVYFMIIEFGRV